MAVLLMARLGIQQVERELCKKQMMMMKVKLQN